jgi:hypothetical protein
LKLKAGYGPLFLFENYLLFSNIPYALMLKKDSDKSKFSMIEDVEHISNVPTA